MGEACHADAGAGRQAAFREGGAPRVVQDLRNATESRLRDLRGGTVGMVFQNPLTALKPLYTAGFQIARVFWRHRGLGRAAQYPHQFSDGMRQRAMIATALAGEAGCRYLLDLRLDDQPVWPRTRGATAAFIAADVDRAV